MVLHDHEHAEEKRWAGQSSWGVGDWAISGLPEHRVLWGRVAAQVFLDGKANLRTVSTAVKWACKLLFTLFDREHDLVMNRRK